MPTQDNNQPTIELLRKYVLSRLANTDFTAEDTVALQEWADKSEENRRLLDRINDIKQIEDGLEDISYFNNSLSSSVEEVTQQIYRLQKKPIKIPAYRFLAAASVLAVCFLSYWVFRHGSHSNDQSAKYATQADIDPGGDKAILILADGSLIVLDSAANGTLTRQGNTRIIKLNGGQLAYDTHPGKPYVTLYNTISTPKGGQYQVVLPDGTHVWLNAASSLTFPTAFRDSLRTVQLKGEGYFEVAPSKSAPFVVRTAESTIRVLGTHFDVSDYPEDSLQKTTLLEGAVKVTKGTGVVVLEPEEQAQIKQGGGLTVVKAINADRAIAWKNGLFDFDHVGLYSAMRQIARWYDVQVIYERTVPDKLLFGSLPRDTKLSMILSLLRRVDVRCRMEGRTVFVSP